MQLQFQEVISRLQDPSFPYFEPTVEVKVRLKEIIGLISSVRENVILVKDPQAKALFETSQEVLKDLVAAYELYDQRKDRAA